MRSNFDETSEALFLTSGYAYNSAEEAEATFKGESNHFQYSRFGNPTVSMFEDRLAALEGAEACRATSTGMSAVFYALLALLKAGDRIVAARQLFGSCHYIINDLLPKYGIKGELVDGGDLKQWEKALSTPTQAVLFESPSNPMLDIVDVKAVCDLAHKAGAKVVLDNAFATPILQRPLEFGADVVVHSATKYIDGQGRTLGGAILGSRDFIIDKLQPITRNTGPSISPFNAWVFVKGLETLGLRIDRHCANAAQGRRRAGGASDDRPRALSRPARPSAARAGGQADVELRRRRHLRHQGRQAGDVRGAQPPAAGRHLQQPGRRQEHGHPSGDDDAHAHRRRGAGQARHRRRHRAHLGRPRGCRRHHRRPGPGARLIARCRWRASSGRPTPTGPAKILAHPFVQGLGDGSLPVGGFKSYVAQDAYFLDAFARAYAFCLAHGTSREDLFGFSELIAGVLEELKLHKSYTEQLQVVARRRHAAGRRRRPMSISCSAMRGRAISARPSPA